VSELPLRVQRRADQRHHWRAYLSTDEVDPGQKHSPEIAGTFG
jgi:hypothetical protein